MNARAQCKGNGRSAPYLHRVATVRTHRELQRSLHLARPHLDSCAHLWAAYFKDVDRLERSQQSATERGRGLGCMDLQGKAVKPRVIVQKKEG